MTQSKEVVGYKHSTIEGEWEEITRQKARKKEKIIPALAKHAFQAKEATKPYLTRRITATKPMLPKSWVNAWRQNRQAQKLFRTPAMLKRYAQSHGFNENQTSEINQHYINTICGRPHK